MSQQSPIVLPVYIIPHVTQSCSFYTGGIKLYQGSPYSSIPIDILIPVKSHEVMVLLSEKVDN